ncbi:MAG: protein TolR [Candidatus Paracaedimonas acanthamoebae]|uniref:Protein TolR n=1 Tax=Candidatus Paracaedimonas acanthamoebae TaxID=244581 RepID=A0A8J7Q1R0_9PROT|nr:protein TolR [Candidatus Paracaedimonas acanthamoebae]
MAGDLQTSASLGKRKSGRRRTLSGLKSEINMTPMVDVMLVLLVIFMVTAPLMTVGVPLDLPKTKAAAINEKTEPLTISVTSDSKIYIQETEVKLETLVAQLQAITSAKPDTRIFVRGDQRIAYGFIMQVMGTLSAAGFDKIALMAELPQGNPEVKAKAKNPK